MPLLEILRLLAVASGLCLVYLAAFTYESTDKRIQNSLEDLWLKFAYDRRTPAGVAKRLARVVLSLMDKIFDRVFGPRQLSIRTLSIAFCYAYAGLVLYFVPLHLFASLARIDFDSLMKDLPPIAGGRVPIIGATMALLIGTIPIVHASLRWVTYLTASLIMANFALVAWVITAGRSDVAVVPPSIEATDVLWALVALACGVGVVHAIRFAVRTTVKGEATRRDVVIVASVLGIPLVAFAVIASVSLIASRPRGRLTIWLSTFLSTKSAMFLLLLFGPSSVWGFGLSIAVALTLIVLLHIIMWPAIRFFLMKTLYAAQRHKLITEKGRLWGTGLGLVACAAAPGELWKLATNIMSKIR